MDLKMISFGRQIFFLGATALIGVSAGLAAVGFQYGSQWILQEGIIKASSLPFWTFAIIALGLITTGALITGWLMQRFAPEAAGSGIPQVKMAYVKEKFDFSWSLLLIKFFGGIFSIGTGSSLGREGPTIHIGATLASKIASSAKEGKEATANAVCAGAAAGLAAAFNSPLAGVTLVLEEIAESQRMEKYAGRSLLASAIAVSIVYWMIGDQAALPITRDIAMKTEILWLSPFVAVFASLIGVFFQWFTLCLRSYYKTSCFPLWLKPATGAFICGILGLITFAFTSKLGVFSLGEHDLNSVLNNQLAWGTAAFLLITKLFATIFCYSSGGCGGIFAPLIFFGGMVGAIVYAMMKSIFHLEGQDQILLSLIGMTACLGSVVRAPLTSILIVMEMTRQIHILPALMIAAVIAVFFNTFFFKDNFYNESLKQDKLLV